MKKTSVFLAIVLLSVSAVAEESADVMSNLTLAAAETGASPIWARKNLEPSTEKTSIPTLEKKALALQNNINAKLEKALEEKLAQEFEF